MTIEEARKLERIVSINILPNATALFKASDGTQGIGYFRQVEQVLVLVDNCGNRFLLDYDEVLGGF